VWTTHDSGSVEMSGTSERSGSVEMCGTNQCLGSESKVWTSQMFGSGSKGLGLVRSLSGEGLGRNEPKVWVGGKELVTSQRFGSELVPVC